MLLQNVPRGILRSVLVSGVAGWILLGSGRPGRAGRAGRQPLEASELSSES